MFKFYAHSNKKNIFFVMKFDDKFLRFPVIILIVECEYLSLHFTPNIGRRKYVRFMLY